MTTEETVRHFFNLLESGETLAAIEQYYDAEAAQMENNDPAVRGKEALLQLEKENLLRVQSFCIHIPQWKLDPSNGYVTGEMIIEFQDKKGNRKKLEERFIQHWKNNKLVFQRFDYNTILNAD